jgi:hypothetical protein
LRFFDRRNAVVIQWFGSPAAMAIEQRLEVAEALVDGIEQTVAVLWALIASSERRVVRSDTNTGVPKKAA